MIPPKSFHRPINKLCVPRIKTGRVRRSKKPELDVIWNPGLDVHIIIFMMHIAIDDEFVHIIMYYLW